MTELVQIEVEAGVADVRLNRPEKMNALSAAMFAAIGDAGQVLAARRDVRAVVLSGNGRCFCAGLDFGSFQGMASGAGARPPAAAGRPAASAGAENGAQRAALVWKQLPMPVIAAVHGVAFGGGFQIALGADIRYAGADARFSVMEIKWGLIPDMGITQTLRDLVRIDVAKELTFSGRIVDAEEAVRLGIVTRLVAEPRTAALALAREIAARSPDAIRAGKRLFNDTWHEPAAQTLPLEAAMQGALIGSPNQVEAVKANFDQRPPLFRDVG